MTDAVPAQKPALSDVMIAMDVVDTLRADERLIEQELNDDKRRKALIKRLREIYRGQGIEVPDRILEDGVRALEDSRFVYAPPAAGFGVMLAKLYVSRGRWGRWLIGGLGAIVALWIGWELFYAVPRAREQAALQRELSVILPARLDAAAERVKSLAKARAVIARAEALKNQGKSAAAAGEGKAARDAQQQLDAMIETLESAYSVRVVSRRGELSGLWRIPRINPEARNYYLVVEALDADGRIIERSIANEETGETERVKKWAVRVPKDVFDLIEADKRDDGVIQKAVIGVKERGEMEPRWSFDLPGGAITKW